MSFKLLIVEDYPEVRHLLKYLFDDKGLQILTARDGKQGLHLALSQHPDLIISDIVMPNMNGIELVKQLRLDPDHATTPILIFTAFSEMDAARILEAGATEVFYKPLGLRAMMEFVADYVHQVNIR